MKANKLLNLAQFQAINPQQKREKKKKLSLKRSLKGLLFSNIL